MLLIDLIVMAAQALYHLDLVFPLPKAENELLDCMYVDSQLPVTWLLYKITSA